MASRPKILVWAAALSALLLLTDAGSGFGSEKILLSEIQVAGWQATDVQSYVGKALYDAIDGYADFHMGFNFKDSERRFFISGDKRIEAFSYRFDTPENAFGLFSIMRIGSPKPVDIGNEASLDGRVLHMWKGDYYIAVSDLGKAEASPDEILSFAKAVDAQFSKQYSKPSIVQTLPAKNLVPHSVAYFHYRNALERLTYLGEENVLQVGDDLTKPYDVEAAYGQFLLDKAKCELIVLRYESPKKSEVAAQMFIDGMKGSLKTSTTNRPWAELVERNGKQTILFREGNVLMLSFPTTKGEVVKELMNHVLANLKRKNN